MQKFFLPFDLTLGPGVGDRITDHFKCWDESRNPAHELAWEWVLRMSFWLRTLLGQPVSGLSLGGGTRTKLLLLIDMEKGQKVGSKVSGQGPRGHKAVVQVLTSLESHVPSWASSSPAVQHGSRVVDTGKAEQRLHPPMTTKPSRGGCLCPQWAEEQRQQLCGIRETLRHRFFLKCAQRSQVTKP